MHINAQQNTTVCAPESKTSFTQVFLVGTKKQPIQNIMACPPKRGSISSSIHAPKNSTSSRVTSRFVWTIKRSRIINVHRHTAVHATTMKALAAAMCMCMA